MSFIVKVHLFAVHVRFFVINQSSHLLALAWYKAKNMEHLLRIKLTNNGLLA